MRRRKNLIPLIAVTLLSWPTLAILILKFPPGDKLLIINYQFSTFLAFIVLVFLACFSLFSLLLDRTRWGFLMALGIVAIVLLRFFKLTHPFYFIIVVLVIAAIEFIFRKR